MLSLNLDMLEEPTLLPFFFFQAEDGIRDTSVTGVQTCALPISGGSVARPAFGNFMNVETTEAELAADVVKALAKTLGKLPFGTLLQPADSDDSQAHKDQFPARLLARSEERRVGKESRCRWWPD